VIKRISALITLVRVCHAHHLSNPHDKKQKRNKTKKKQNKKETKQKRNKTKKKQNKIK
jgi:hypothetical protein